MCLQLLQDEKGGEQKLELEAAEGDIPTRCECERNKEGKGWAEWVDRKEGIRNYVWKMELNNQPEEEDLWLTATRTEKMVWGREKEQLVEINLQLNNRMFVKVGGRRSQLT